MIDVHGKLTAAGYSFVCRTEAGRKYVKDSFIIYHSGYMLIVIRRGGMTRAFNVDRLLFFSVNDLERQINIRPSGYLGKEDKMNYDYAKRF